MIGKTILHYKILEQVGQGGMGVVYKAEDTKLERMVAIKFLPPHIAANKEERQRFKIEAKAAAALSHPSIAHIYAIEESDNQMFIVMEYIEGKELKDIIKSEIPNPKSAIDYAIQIAEGLKTAHNKGIVHRDIKSANIMLTDEGQIKIMDFGLAKVRGGVQVTKVGTTLGTAAYMSPEQTRGEEVDQRSDIWSLGVVLFEMLTGKLPFAGEYEQAVTYSILNEIPDLSIIPTEMQSILQKALAKEANKRYQKTEELLADLKNLKGETSSQSTSSRIVTPAEQKKSISKRNLILAAAGVGFVLIILFYFTFLNRAITEEASSQRKMLVILPFQNLGPAEQEYFADGITGEITSRLSGISGLGVIARSSAMQYKNTTKSLHEISEELSVAYVLEGTIQWEENADGSRRVRVNPELIKIADETQVWSQPYEEDFSSVFKLQSDIATKVADALDITLLQTEKKSLGEELTKNSEAYDYYLRGLDYLSDTYDQNKYSIAEQLFQKAVELDPNFAAAFAALANYNLDMYWFHFDHTEERVKQAKEFVDKAMRLDPNLSVVHEAMGWYHYHGKLNYEPALKEFKDAIKIQPNSAQAYVGIASVLRRQGKMEQAAEYFIKASEIDPRNPTIPQNIAETYVLLRKYDQADVFTDRSIALAPDNYSVYQTKIDLYVLKNGNIIKARQTIEEAFEKKMELQSPLFNHRLSKVEILEGEYTKALQDISGAGSFDDQFQFVPEELATAQIYRLLNNHEMEQKYYNAARKILEGKIKIQPEDSRFHTSLGIAYAGLGQKEDAVREGKKGVELLPMSKEAWRGSFRVRDMAEIYTMVGEQDAAINLLEKLLSNPSEVSVALLKIDPTWDPLRDNPKFQQLLQKYSGANT
jgi:serine/threonine protein kinase/Tfp pilus assembly protein PilF